MAEQGSFQRGLDAVAQGYREHKGTITSAAILAAGSGAAVARVEGAAVVGVVGAAGLILSSGAEYFFDIHRRASQPDQSLASSTNETTILTPDELGLAGGAEESSPST